MNTHPEDAPDNAAPDNAAPAQPADAPAEPARSPVFNLHGSVVALALACIVVHVLRVYVLPVDAERQFLIATAFFPVRYLPTVFQLDLPTLFSPFTYAFLHGSWFHLGFNLVWFFVFGSPLAFRLGWTRNLLFWAVTSALAAATHLAFYFGDPVPIIGASGAISGYIGAAARYGLMANRRNPQRGFDGPLLSIGQTLRIRGVLFFLIVWIGLNAFIGVDPLGLDQQEAPVAWIAHIGGLVAGFFLIPLFDRWPRGRPLDL